MIAPTHLKTFKGRFLKKVGTWAKFSPNFLTGNLSENQSTDLCWFCYCRSSYFFGFKFVQKTLAKEWNVENQLLRNRPQDGPWDHSLIRHTKKVEKFFWNLAKFSVSSRYFKILSIIPFFSKIWLDSCPKLSSKKFFRTIYRGVESIKNKKTHLRFYRWSTDCSFGYRFWKTTPVFFRTPSQQPLQPHLLKTAP